MLYRLSNTKGRFDGMEAMPSKLLHSKAYENDSGFIGMAWRAQHVEALEATP